MAKDKDVPKVPNVELPDEAVGLSQRIEARLEMVLGQLSEVRRENAELKVWVQRVARKGRIG